MRFSLRPQRIVAYATLNEIPPLPPELEVRRRSDDDGLAADIDQLKERLWRLAGGEMTAQLFESFAHLDMARWRIEVAAIPERRAELNEWARGANAVLLLPEDSLVNPEGGVLVARGGGEDDAFLPHPPSATNRAMRIRAALEAEGIWVPPGLPPVVGDDEVRLRDARDVAARACALLAVAVHAGGLVSEENMQLDDIWGRLNYLPEALSPLEAMFLTNERPSEQDITDMQWRYESCRTLLWSLGAVASMPPPHSEPRCAEVGEALLALVDSGAQPTLRPISEILDQLDLEYRRRWAVVQAQLTGEPPPGELNADVLYERHLALNWLTCYGRAPWDEVETPT